jgi:DNA polymerase III subunit delta'
VSIVPLYGHDALRRRLRDAIAREALPGSLLLGGPRGIGKQRLALWLGQLLLCTGAGERPCGRCMSCRYAARLVHPDLRWFFPRPRLGEADASPEQVLDDYADAIAERVERNGLCAAPSGSEAIFVATVRAIVQLAAYTPTLGNRKVFVIGDAERMVPQEGADAAANAFLKLLEEPPADTTLVLTSSEPGALLPTIRSRVVSLRVTPLRDADVSAFLADEAVRKALDGMGLPSDDRERLRIAAGAPGSLLAASARDEAMAVARSLLEAVQSGRAERMRTAFTLGGSKARGLFSDVLDALTALLDDRARDAVMRGDERSAAAAGFAIDAVEMAKLRAAGNVSPQLLGASLMGQLAERLA